MKSKLAAALGMSLASLAVFAGTAAARPLAHGDFIHVTRHLNANQSNNWFGYNQGSLEQGTKLFSSITGDWTVPTATQHTAGQDESSSDWIGIGGGCVDAGCTVDRPDADPDRHRAGRLGRPGQLLGLVGARPGAVADDLEHHRLTRRSHARQHQRGRHGL